MKFVFSLLFIIQLATFTTKAQTGTFEIDNIRTDTVPQTEDYVITVKGDTIKCRVIFPFFGGDDKYKIDGQSKRIKTEEIQEYYINRKNLRKRAVFDGDEKKAEYMTVLEKGKISLYEVIISSGRTSSTYWYVGKNSDRVKFLKTSALTIGKSHKERKDDFAEMLKDQPVIYQKYIAEDKFSFKVIHNLIHLYNTGRTLDDEKSNPDPKKDAPY